MAVRNLYSNLPGHLVVFKDGGLQLTTKTTDTASTKSILILGTAFDGPINEPVKIDETTVSQVFGKEVDADGYPTRATLTKYAKQAFKSGFDDVRCMRVTGSEAFTTLEGKQKINTKKMSGEAHGGDAANPDGGATGFVKGNKAYKYVIADTDAAFLASSPSKDDKITITHADGSANVIGLSDLSGAWSFNPYMGFSVADNSFLATDDVTLQYNPIQFALDDGTSVVPVNVRDVASAGISTLTGTVADKKVVFKAHANYKFFRDNNAVTVTDGKIPAVPQNGAIKVTLKGTPITENNDFIATLSDGDATLTIDFSTIASSTAADGDTVTVNVLEYTKLPLATIQVPNVQFNPTEINTPGLSAKQNATVTSVTTKTVGATNSVAVASGDYTVDTANDKVVINNTGNAKLGDAITVAYTYEVDVNDELTIKVKSQFGGSMYKDATVKVTKESADNGKTYTVLTFKRPSAKGVGTFSYSSKTVHTIDDLILSMQNDDNNVNMFGVEIVKGEGTDSLDLLAATDEKAFDQGGDDGVDVTANEMFEALSGVRITAAEIGQPISPYSDRLIQPEDVGLLKRQGAYQILENYNVDCIYPAGVYADMKQTINPNSDFQRELALACMALTYRTRMTHGFIDVKPNSNTTLIGVDDYVAKLVDTRSNRFYMTDMNGDVILGEDNKPMDIGWYTSAVVGPEPIMFSDTLGTYYGSPAIAYAALNAVIAPQSSPMNKAIRNAQGLKFKLSNKQMDALIGAGYVVFKLKNEGLAAGSNTPYVVNGDTAGGPNCDYKDIAVVKVVKDVVDRVREVCDPFIGEPNTLPQRNAMSAQISKVLAKLADPDVGEIQGYDFTVSATLEQQISGKTTIALTIIPATTLKEITTVVALRAAE